MVGEMREHGRIARMEGDTAMSGSKGDQSDMGMRGKRRLLSRTEIIHRDFDPGLSVGAAVTPIFLTSTFAFSSAEAGARAFELAFYPDRAKKGEESELIYSRLSHPGAEIVEKRVAAFEPGAGQAAAFASGMSAITTTVMALMTPMNPYAGLSGANVIAFTHPVYGGTNCFFENIMPQWGFVGRGIDTSNLQATESVLDDIGPKLGMFFIETPANPTLMMTDIAAVARMAKKANPACIVVVDNTFMGVFQEPFTVSPDVDIVIYSATKFMGGHSSLIGGFAVTAEGRDDLMGKIRGLRTTMGTIACPFVCWQLLNALPTMGLRMEKQAMTADKVAAFLSKHPRVAEVKHPSLFQEGTAEHDVFKKQCTGTGSIITFTLKDAGREDAFRFLDAVAGTGVILLAVSLGSVESLIEHPASMTHCDGEMEESARLQAGITEGAIRFSIGLENSEDIIWALEVGLDAM